MKKILIYLATMLFILNIIGCKSSEQSSTSENKKFDMKKAESLIDNYMQALIREDDEGIKKALNDKLNKNAENPLKSALRVKGYSKTENYQVGDTGIFKVKVASTSLTSTKASLDTYTIKVALVNWNYKISDIKSTVEKESYYENYGLRIRNKNNVKSDLLIDSDGIPQFGFSKEDNAKIDKLELPRSNFSNIDFAYSGDSIAISTVNDVTFVSIVNISSDSVPTVGTGGQSEAGGGGGGGSQTGQSSSQGQNAGPREIPVGKEISTLDVIKNGKVDFMVFSPDEKLLVLQYTNSNKMKCLKIYDTEKSDLIPFKFEENYNTNNVEILYSYFDKDMLYFQVVSKDAKRR